MKPAIHDDIDERRASNLEIFIDLVFVFAIMQVTSLISEGLTWGSVGRGALVAWLVWSLWSQYVWAGTVLNLERSGYARRTVVRGSIPPALLMAKLLDDPTQDGVMRCCYASQNTYVTGRTSER